jgi:hypothetical protein
LTILHELADRLRQFQKPKEIGNRRSILPQPHRQFRLGQAKLIDQRPIGVGPIHRVQVFPLDVLNERQLGLLIGIGLADNGRDRRQIRQFRSPEPALTCNQLIPRPPCLPPHDHRLDQPG